MFHSSLIGSYVARADGFSSVRSHLYKSILLPVNIIDKVSCATRDTHFPVLSLSLLYSTSAVAQAVSPAV